MPTIDVLLTAHHVSSQDPRERYANTLQFNADQGPDANSGALQALVDAWAARPGLAWANYVDVAIGSIELRAYNMDDPPPREPFILHNTVAGALGSSGGPSQVGLCLSFYSGRNLPRQRGRIYLGPLSEAVIGMERPSSTIRTAALDLGQAIHGVGAPGVFDWICGSTAGGVTDVWCNDVWDTQRRRCPEETARSTRAL